MFACLLLLSQVSYISFIQNRSKKVGYFHLGALHIIVKAKVCEKWVQQGQGYQDLEIWPTQFIND